jgi:hypothetical protein
MVIFDATDFLNGQPTFDVSSLTSLKYLFMNDLNITTFPKGITTLPLIEEITVRFDNVVVPDLAQFCGLAHLTKMYLTCFVAYFTLS